MQIKWDKFIGKRLIEMFYFTSEENLKNFVVISTFFLGLQKSTLEQFKALFY
jgi:hypothetical protein